MRAYERDGYVVIRGMYSAAEVRELSEAVTELASRVPSVGRQMVYLEESLLSKGERILSRIERFSQYQPALGRYINEPRMIETASRLLGDRAVLFKEKINFKLPGGGGFTPHQDIQPGWDEYAPFFLSVLVTIDDSTIENGCLELAAGHHKRGLIGRKWQPLEGEELRGIEFVPYPMSAGDVAFFDCFVPHRSKPNLTDSPRRNMYLTFNRAKDGDHRERYFTDKRRSYPPDHEREPGKAYVFKV